MKSAHLTMTCLGQKRPESVSLLRPALKLGLQARYLLLILSLILALVTLLSVALLVEFRGTTQTLTDASVRSTSEHLAEQLVERGAFITKTLAENMINPLYDYDIDGISLLLQSIRTQRDVVEALVTDDGGYLLHDGTPSISRFGEQLLSPTVQQALERGESVSWLSKEAVYLTEPVRIGEQLLGLVHLQLSRESTNKRIDRSAENLARITEQALMGSRRTAIIIGGLFLIVGALAAYRFARSLTHPITELAEHAARIGDGSYPVPIATRRRDELGELAGAFNSMNARLQESARSMHRMAYHDSLTGLPNRARFNQLLEKSVAGTNRTRSVGALMFMDLDHFKRVNDSLGHQAGDELLCEFARRISAVVCDGGLAGTEAGTLARLGGDEFTVLLPRVGHRDNARRVAARILEVLQEPMTLIGQPVVAGVSIGICLFPEDARDTESLLHRADFALYQSKEIGRNRFRFYEPEQDGKSAERVKKTG